jgi:hypothetical protein
MEQVHISAVDSWRGIGTRATRTRRLLRAMHYSDMLIVWVQRTSSVHGKLLLLTRTAYNRPAVGDGDIGFFSYRITTGRNQVLPSAYHAYWFSVGVSFLFLTRFSGISEDGNSRDLSGERSVL